MSVKLFGKEGKMTPRNVPIATPKDAAHSFKQSICDSDITRCRLKKSTVLRRGETNLVQATQWLQFGHWSWSLLTFQKSPSPDAQSRIFLLPQHSNDTSSAPCIKPNIPYMLITDLVNVYIFKHNIIWLHICVGILRLQFREDWHWSLWCLSNDAVRKDSVRASSLSPFLWYVPTNLELASGTSDAVFLGAYEMAIEWLRGK